MLVKLNIFVPEELRTTIKIEAARMGVTMQQYVIMAVEEYLKEHHE